MASVRRAVKSRYLKDFEKNNEINNGKGIEHNVSAKVIGTKRNYVVGRVAVSRKSKSNNVEDIVVI